MRRMRWSENSAAPRFQTSASSAWSERARRCWCAGRWRRPASNPDTGGALPRFLAIYGERALEHTRPYDGIPAVLDWLVSRVPLALLTNKPLAATDYVLAGLGLAAYFRDTIGGDSPFGRKPDPGGLQHLARAHGADPGDTLMVGDSSIDRDTARGAGTRICLARYGFGFRIPPDQLRPDDLLIDRPMDLIATIEPLLHP